MTISNIWQIRNYFHRSFGYYTKLIIFSFVALSIVLNSSCAIEEEEDMDIVVYGSKSCANTTNMKGYLDGKGVDYSYRDIYEKPEQRDKMWKKLAGANLDDDFIILPVVDINGKIFVNPTVCDIDVLIEEYKSESAKGQVCDN